MLLLPEKSLAFAAAILIVLWMVPRLEGWINKSRGPRIYEVVWSIGEAKMAKIERLFLESGLRVRRRRWAQSGEDMISQWEVHGAPEAHKRLVIMLFAHPDVKGFQIPAGGFPLPERAKSATHVRLSAFQCPDEGDSAQLILHGAE